MNPLQRTVPGPEQHAGDRHARAEHRRPTERHSDSRSGHRRDAPDVSGARSRSACRRRLGHLGQADLHRSRRRRAVLRSAAGLSERLRHVAEPAVHAQRRAALRQAAGPRQHRPADGSAAGAGDLGVRHAAAVFGAVEHRLPDGDCRSRRGPGRLVHRASTATARFPASTSTTSTSDRRICRSSRIRRRPSRRPRTRTCPRSRTWCASTAATPRSRSSSRLAGGPTTRFSSRSRAACERAVVRRQRHDSAVATSSSSRRGCSTTTTARSRSASDQATAQELFGNNQPAPHVDARVLHVGPA